jgi:hypothetical protein
MRSQVTKSSTPKTLPKLPKRSKNCSIESLPPTQPKIPLSLPSQRSKPSKKIPHLKIESSTLGKKPDLQRSMPLSIIPLSKSSPPLSRARSMLRKSPVGWMGNRLGTTAKPEKRFSVFWARSSSTYCRPECLPQLFHDSEICNQGVS